MVGMAWWRRRRHVAPAVARGWPRPGAVALVSAEWQEAAFIDVSFIERVIPSSSTPGGSGVLRRTGPERWVPLDELSSLRQEVAALLDGSDSDDERKPLQLALEMIDDVGDRGILHVPASDVH